MMRCGKGSSTDIHTGSRTHSRSQTHRLRVPHLHHSYVCNVRPNATGTQTSNGTIQNLVRQIVLRSQASGRGLTIDEESKRKLLADVEQLRQASTDVTTTGSSTLSATWKLLFTTEQETLFILQNAGFFGTKAGEVYQVIDVDANTLQNVITFPPDGAFIVNSSISIAGPQRVDFKFQAAQLKLPSRSIPIPPFGQGWFDNVYVDDAIRIAKDIRGDVLVVERDGRPRSFS